MADTASNQTTHDLGKVRDWIAAMADRGNYQPTSARLRATALEQITSVLAEDESHDPQWVLDNIDSITARWATKNNAKGETGQTYKSRAKGALEDYFRYQLDPLAFKPRVKAVPSEPAKKSTERKAARAEDDTEDEMDTTAAPPVAPPPSFRSYPLDGQGKEFLFQLPPGGLTTRDVQRIAWHLATMATDFDPFQAAARNPLLPKDD